jgi:predicted unusual protein kinase regulating ubiquinone biosynthesis (AarF/ABC1/UbiB family)
VAKQDKIPTSRTARAAKIGRVAAVQATKQAGTRVANVGRSEEKRAVALEKRQIEAAEQIVAVLGTMKGAAMKLGQVLSFLDVGLVPEDYREEFQRKLAVLRDAAPKVAFKDMKKVIEDDLEDKLSEVFATFDEEPIAAASIGQVYRATLHDGRDVVVKVQYPGVANAVRSDMQNLGLIMRLMKRMAPGMDTDSVTAEIRDRIHEELDYELEAGNQRSLARVFRGHPFIVIPPVVSDLSRERVMVSEYVEGIGFEAVKELPQEEKDRVAEIIFRFYFQCLYRHRQFSGDPHPGNFLLMGDGKIAFLDFGLFKTIGPEPVELELECQRAVIEGDAERLHKLLSDSGFLPHPEKVDAEKLMAYVNDSIWWYTTADEELELTPEIATKVLIEASDVRSSHYREMRHQDIKPEHLLGRRMEMLTLAVMSQLYARGNWHRIAREWIYGDEPETELGRAEAEFYGAPAGI